MSVTKIQLNAEKLEKALAALKRILAKPMDEERSNIDAAIQRFEFSFELFWKYLKSILNDRGVDVSYPRDVLSAAYQGHLIDHESLWLNMLKDRNLTSHSYDEALAEQIYQSLDEYCTRMTEAFLSLNLSRSSKA